MNRLLPLSLIDAQVEVVRLLRVKSIEELIDEARAYLVEHIVDDDSVAVTRNALGVMMFAAEKEGIDVQRILSKCFKYVVEYYQFRGAFGDGLDVKIHSDFYEQLMKLKKTVEILANVACLMFPEQIKRLVDLKLEDENLEVLKAACFYMCLLDSFSSSDEKLQRIIANEDLAWHLVMNLKGMPRLYGNNKRGRELRQLVVSLARHDNVRRLLLGIPGGDSPFLANSTRIEQERSLLLREVCLPLLKYQDTHAELVTVFSGSYPQIIPLLAAGLQDEQTHSVHVELLCTYGDAAVASLIELLKQSVKKKEKDKSRAAVHGVEHALVAMRDRAITPLLLLGIENKDARPYVKTILERIGEPVFRVVLSHVAKASWEDRLILLEFMPLGDSEVAQLYELRFDDQLGPAATFCLSWSGHDAAISALLEQLDNPLVAIEAAKGLIEIGGDAIAMLCQKADPLLLEQIFADKSMKLEVLRYGIVNHDFCLAHRDLVEWLVLWYLECPIPSAEKTSKEDVIEEHLLDYVTRFHSEYRDRAIARMFAQKPTPLLRRLLLHLERRTLPHIELLLQGANGAVAEAQEIVRRIAVPKAEKYPWIASVVADKDVDRPEVDAAIELLDAMKLDQSYPILCRIFRESTVTARRRRALEALSKLSTIRQRELFSELFELMLSTPDAHLSIAAARIVAKLGVSAESSDIRRLEREIKRYPARSDRRRSLSTALSAVK